MGNWTLNVYDVDNVDATGFMLNWTLTLFGEQDPTLEDTPIHLSTSIHEDKEDEVSTTSSTKATTTVATTATDDTPSRPTPNKISSSRKITRSTSSATKSTDASTPSASETSSEDSQDQGLNLVGDEDPETLGQNDSHDYLTIVYGIFGSIAIFGVASALYFHKRNGWRSPSITAVTTANDRHLGPGGYEFDVLQPLTELDEDELSESDSDREEDARLVRNHTQP